MKLKMGAVLLALLFCFPIPNAAEAKITILGSLSHEKSAQVGETYRGIIFIQNPSEELQEVKIYQTDYLFFCDGSNIYGEPGKDPRSNAKWIAFSPRRVLIPPGEQSGINYTVKVPDDETLAGSHWSMFMIEAIPTDSPESETGEPKEGEAKVSIRTILRYGIQMVTDIGETGTHRLKFLMTKLLKEQEKRTLQVDIENNGERWLRPLLWTELYDEKGNYIGRFEGGRLRTYPGTSVRFRIDLSEVPKGKYKALIVADCGGDDLFGATYDLEFEE